MYQGPQNGLWSVGGSVIELLGGAEEGRLAR